MKQLKFYPIAFCLIWAFGCGQKKGSYNYLAAMSNDLGIPKPYFSFLVKQYNKEGVLIPEKSGLFRSNYKNRIDFSVEKKRDRYVNEFIKELDEIK